MKNITATILTLAMLLALTACGEGNDTPATTTATTTVATTTATADTTTTATADTTTETTAPVEDRVDIDALLEGYTVYEVTTDEFLDPFDILYRMEDSDKPIKIAIRCTDADGLTVLADSTESDPQNHQYYIKKVFNDNAEIPLDYDNKPTYHGLTFSADYSNGVTVIRDGDGFGYNATYYFINGKGCCVLSNTSSETEVVLHIYVNDDDKLVYTKTALKYHVNNFEAFLMAYESDEDFYEERGSISLNDDGVVFVPSDTKTIGDGHKWSDIVNTFCERYGLDSTGELVELYKQYVSEGKQREFMELD